MKQKLGRILVSKIRPDPIYILVLCPSLRIRSQLPASIPNGRGLRGDSFWKWPDFQLWRVRDLDLGMGHTAYHRASLTDVYLHANFCCNRRNFVDGRTDIWDWLY